MKELSYANVYVCICMYVCVYVCMYTQCSKIACDAKAVGPYVVGADEVCECIVCIYMYVCMYAYTILEK